MSTRHAVRSAAPRVWRKKSTPHAIHRHRAKLQAVVAKDRKKHGGGQRLHGNQAAAKVAVLLAWGVVGCNQTRP